MLHVRFEEENHGKIAEVTYSSVADIPAHMDGVYLGFAASCEGRQVLGGGFSKKIIELDGVEWMDDFPEFNYQRFHAASVYHPEIKRLIL